MCSKMVSPDGKLVLTGSDDHTARLWEAAGGKLIATLSGQDAAVAPWRKAASRSRQQLPWSS